MDHQLAEGLLRGLLQGERVQPGGRDPARRGLPLADLVAVDHQHVGAAGGQLAGHGEPGEARAADQDVAVAIQRGAFLAALGRASWASRSDDTGRVSPECPLSAAILREHMSPTTTLIPPTDQSSAKVVEGSNGLLLEIDGQIVPNYDATVHPFQEGDVVTGHVVRIDNDEVLVDIGYKSEGVIPPASCRSASRSIPARRSRSARRSTRWF